HRETVSLGLRAIDPRAMEPILLPTLLPLGFDGLDGRFGRTLRLFDGHILTRRFRTHSPTPFVIVSQPQRNSSGSRSDLDGAGSESRFWGDRRCATTHGWA